MSSKQEKREKELIALLDKATNPEVEPYGVHYSLDFYCFFKINPTFAIRN